MRRKHQLWRPSGEVIRSPVLPDEGPLAVHRFPRATARFIVRLQQPLFSYVFRTSCHPESSFSGRRTPAVRSFSRAPARASAHFLRTMKGSFTLKCRAQDDRAFSFRGKLWLPSSQGAGCGVAWAPRRRRSWARERDLVAWSESK